MIKPGFIKQKFIPDIDLIVRESTGESYQSLVLKRLKKIGFKNFLIFILNNIRFLRSIFRRDFATGIKILCEFEVLKTAKKHYVLDSSLVDTAVAFNNQKLINHFFYLANKYGFKPGLATYNLGPFIKLLSTVEAIPQDLVIYTPINKDSYMMNPSYEDLLDFIKNSRIQFIRIGND